MIVCSAGQRRKNMALIVIEGADGVGKATQVDLLYKRLHDSERTVTKFDFPQYKEKMIGAFIGEQLAGKHGDFLALSPYVASLSYTIDRATRKEDIVAASSNGNIALLDRYSESNKAFQAAKIADPVERKKFLKFIDTVEHEEVGVPRATMVIYLAGSVEISAELIKQKSARAHLGGAAKDQYEGNIEYQRRVALIYREFARTHEHWRLIECVRGDMMRTPADIHEEIWWIVLNHIGGNDIRL